MLILGYIRLVGLVCFLVILGRVTEIGKVVELDLVNNKFLVVDLVLVLGPDFSDSDHKQTADRVIFPYPISDFCRSWVHDFFLGYNWNINLGCTNGCDSVPDLCCLNSKSDFYLSYRNDFDLEDVGSFQNYRSVRNDPTYSSVDDPEDVVVLIFGSGPNCMDDFVSSGGSCLGGYIWGVFLFEGSLG
jgi:hypothetical protein